MKKKILFIINPISGLGRQKKIESIIKTKLDYNIFEPTICYTKYAGNAIEIAQQSIGQYNVITAIGGDGSINEVASQLVDTPTALAIVPCGSGNGFARCLGIPLNPTKAIEKLNTATIRKIDTCKVNNKFFISLSGVGFDSLVAMKYQQMESRGLKTYFKAGLNSFFNYKEVEYTLNYNNKSEKTKAFLITVCNSTQYGYNFKIAPKALVDDGILDVAILRRPPLWRIPFTAINILLGRANKSKYISILHCNKLTIEGNLCGYINLDGETIKCQGNLCFENHKQNLNLFC